jgi:precorrin-6Y C5,15-methyltransferase (decarboxylating) CbiT subunit
MSEVRTYQTPGIPDDDFIRGAVPMTKEDVRVLTVCRARLAPGLTVWDVGAGTGSLTVEAALFTPGGRVYAVERNHEGAALIEENCHRFGVGNVTVLQGEAPGALLPLPAPDRVFIGGSGGRLKEILAVCAENMAAGGIVVVNAITPSTMAAALEILALPPFSGLDGIYVQVSRLEALGKERFFKAQNGIWILSARKDV